jgi:NAD-dependent SIR2 family protein deacetylase
MMESDVDQRIDTLVQWMYDAEYLVVFTGAGISTGSGLQDYRGPDGVRTRRDKGLPPRERTDWSSVEPNSGHKALYELQEMGKMAFLIAQNIDNLHLKSGIRPDLLAELHGNITRLRCSRCEATVERSAGLEICEHCGGKLVPSVVGFGQSLPRKDLMDAVMHSQKCDLFIVVGSSLVVTPAADMPRLALQHGARLVIINQGETPFDNITHLRFWEDINDVLPPAVERLKVIAK